MLQSAQVFASHSKSTNLQSVGVEVLRELNRNGRHGRSGTPAQEVVRPDSDVAQQLRQRGQQHLLGIRVQRIGQHVAVAL